MEAVMKYFSTRYAIKMLGVRYIPSVCYPLSEVLEPAVKELAEAGNAKLYEGKVRFVSGVPIPVKDAPRKTRPLGTAVPGTAKKGGRKNHGKDFY